MKTPHSKALDKGKKSKNKGEAFFPKAHAEFKDAMGNRFPVTKYSHMKKSDRPSK